MDHLLKELQVAMEDLTDRIVLSELQAEEFVRLPVHSCVPIYSSTRCLHLRGRLMA